MSKPVRIALLVSLWVCCSLLIPSAVGSAEPVGRPALQRLAQFGGMYRRVLGDNPSTLDPAFVTDIYGRAVVSQIFDGLVQFDAHLKPIPAIAEFWEASRDGRTWTFTLRRGVKFHHGREVTAHDFVYSFTRLLDPKKPGPVTELFRRVQGAKEFMQGKTPRRPGAESGGSLYPADRSGRAVGPCLGGPRAGQCRGGPAGRGGKAGRALRTRAGGNRTVQICPVGAEPGDRAGGQRPLLRGSAIS